MSKPRVLPAKFRISKVISLILVPVSGLLLFVNMASASDINESMARQNYILNCQGCHLWDGSGSPGHDVPNMKDFVGNFLHIEGGREFIIQVPGAANAPLSDQELAEVMNWLLINFSRNQLPENYQPYSAAEVRGLRKEALIDINPVRRELIRKIEKQLGVKEATS